MYIDTVNGTRECELIENHGDKFFCYDSSYSVDGRDITGFRKSTRNEKIILKKSNKLSVTCDEVWPTQEGKEWGFVCDDGENREFVSRKNISTVRSKS